MVGLSWRYLIKRFFGFSKIGVPYKRKFKKLNLSIFQNRRRSTSKGLFDWKEFLMKVEIEPEDAPEGDDPDWNLPENYEEETDAESDVSESEVKDLTEALEKELVLDDILPPIEPADLEAALEKELILDDILPPKEPAVQEEKLEKPKEVVKINQAPVVEA